MTATDNYSIREYGRMINDRARMQPLVEALTRAVRPDSVVLDIGTGSGIFALLACRLGAARVYAVEPDDVIDVAKLCANGNPHSDRITWIQGFSTEIELPERADIIVADLRGNLPFHTGNLPSMIDARQRHLKPGGQVIPGRDVLRAVPAQAPHEYRDVQCPWQSNDYGIDFSAGMGFASNSIWRARSDGVASQHLLASPAIWGAIEYSAVDSPNVDGRADWRIERAGTVHGLYVWFDCEVADGLGFSNAPDLPSLPYGRAFFPLQEPVAVVAGDTMRSRISATLIGGQYVFRWDSQLSDASGKNKADFRQSTFKERPLKLAELKRTSVDFVPSLSPEGQVDQQILQSMSARLPLGQIAAGINDRFPDRFASFAAALAHVSKLSMKYSS